MTDADTIANLGASSAPAVVLKRETTDKIKANIKSHRQRNTLFEKAEVKAKTQAAELEEIELLEHRYHALVDLKKRTTSIWSFFWIGWEVVRSIPWLSMVAIIPSLFGLAQCWAQKHTIQDAIVDIDITSSNYSDYFVRYLSVFLVVLVIVDGFVVLASFGAQGATREYIFGHKEHGCMYCLQVMAGPVIYSVLFCLLVLYVLSLFAVEVFVALPGYAFYQVALSACALGEAGKDALVAASVGMENIVDSQYSNFHVNKVSLNESVGHFCSRPAGFHAETVEAFKLFCFGMFICIIGQVTQLTLLTANFESILMQRDLDEENRRSEIRAFYESHRYGTTDV